MEEIKGQKFTNKVLTNVSISLIVVVLAAYFGIYQSIDAVNNHKTQIIDSKIETEKKISREQNLGNLAAKLKKIDTDMKLIDDSFIKSDGELEFITTLENIAEYNHVAQGINLLPAVDNEGLSESLININARGSYSDIVNYLRDLESVKYYIDITTLNFTKQAETGNQTPEEKVNMSLNAKVYWKKYESKN